MCGVRETIDGVGVLNRGCFDGLAVLLKEALLGLQAQKALLPNVAGFKRVALGASDVVMLSHKLELHPVVLIEYRCYSMLLKGIRGNLSLNARTASIRLHVKFA